MDTSQPKMQGPEPEPPEFEKANAGEETDLQQRFRHLDHTKGVDNPGMAGTTGRRRNNAANPHVARTFPKKETQITNG